MSDVYFESSETILTRMKSGITTVSTIEGSDVHNSQAPVSIEMSNIKLQLDEILKKAFAKSALENGYDEWLEKRCNDFGIYRKPGNKATGYITFNGQAGSTIFLNTIVQTETGVRYFTMDTAVIPSGATSVKIKVIAENIGSAYNKIANTITYLPVKIAGITSITNEEAFANGYDVESNEDMYNRYILKLQTPATSGNPAHYKTWALAVNGVGDAKIFEETNLNGEHEAGCVKIVIVNSNKIGADEALINDTTTYINANRPIGATPYVVSATEKAINVSVTIALADGYTLDNVKTNIQNELTSYFKSIAFNKDDVSYAKIGALIYETEGVDDYSNLTVNNGTINIPLADIEIPTFGSVVAA